MGELRLRLCVLQAVAAAVMLSAPDLSQARTGREIHVSPGGDDANAGSVDQPLATIGAAAAVAQPGDSIVLAAGLHRLSGSGRYGVHLTRSGRPSAPIVLRSADGAEAVLDCSGITAPKTVYCLQVEADWWHISNIAVTGSLQNAQGSWAVGINLLNASHNILQSVRSFDHQGPGIVITGRSRDNLLQDCLSYSNYDPKAASPGGNADGIQVTSIPMNAVGNVISDCKSYDNSDDGFDLWKAEAPVSITGSVASRNGYVPGTLTPAGDGVGFKLGKNSRGPRHRIVNNHAVDNRAAGYDSNGAAGEAMLVDNTGTGNGGGNLP